MFFLQHLSGFPDTKSFKLITAFPNVNNEEEKGGSGPFGPVKYTQFENVEYKQKQQDHK